MRRLGEASTHHLAGLVADLNRRAPSPSVAPLVRTTPARLAELSKLRTDLQHDPSLVLQAKALILCSLPYRPVAARSVTRSARLARDAWLHVTFASVDAGIPLAFGADRTLLGWIQTQAYRDGFVAFETLTEFFRAFGLSDGGREYLRFRERLRRLESLAIRIRYETQRDIGSLHLRPILATFAPRAASAPEDRPSRVENPQLVLLRIPGRYGFQLDPTFHEYLRENKVPLPLPLMRAFKNSPQGWDFASLVLYRSYAARSRTIVPWPALVQQLGCEDRSPRRLKANLARVLEEIRIVYRTFPARFLHGRAGLQVEPWQPPQAPRAGAPCAPPAREPVAT